MFQEEGDRNSNFVVDKPSARRKVQRTGMLTDSRMSNRQGHSCNFGRNSDAQGSDYEPIM